MVWHVVLACLVQHCLNLLDDIAHECHLSKKHILASSYELGENHCKIIVKTLPAGTKFITLDEVERELHEEDLMICDGQEKPMCIAGIFGGIRSGVTEHTSSIFL